VPFLQLGPYRTVEELSEHLKKLCLVDAEFTATKTIGKWTFGPVGYVAAQVTDDTSSAYYNYAVNSNRYTRMAAGGLLGYNFGPAALNVWVTDEFCATASGKTPLIAGRMTRGAPQSKFSVLICRISARNAASISGRPPRRRDFQRQ
jgi:outer membrane putative beta-barrel porin/alpha-amylase